MSSESLAQQLASGVASGPLAFGVAFLGGLLAGFGPCILPLLPAVFGYVTGTVAAKTDETPTVAPARALVLSFVFVLGMSAVFTSIGVAAGFLGRALIIGRWAYYLAAVVCAVLGLHMMGLVAVPFDRLNRWLPVKRPERRGLTGALLFGGLFGLVASPCSTPVLGAIATLAALGQDPVRGGLMLFVYGLGKGVPLLLLGVASGSLGLMRRIGNATPVLTRLGGAGLLAASAYIVWLA